MEDGDGDTFPTAASPSRTSFTLLLGLAAAAVASAMLPAVVLLEGVGMDDLRKGGDLRPVSLLPKADA